MEKTGESRQRTVLVVDDERELLSTIAEYLSQYRDFFEVVTAGNGLEALKVLEARPVSVVVTDIQMPEMNGVMLLSHMMNEYPTIPCIVITAYGNPELDKQLKRFGTVGILDKPFDLPSLRKLVVEALDGTREHESLRALSLEAFLQILEMERQSAILEITCPSSGDKGYLYVAGGELIDASFQGHHGEEAAYEILALPKSETVLKAHLRTVERKRVITRKMMHLLMEAMRRVDERKRAESVRTNTSERRLEMAERSTSEIFAEMLEIPGLQAVVVIAKDGFVIEMAGSARNVNMDGLGASLALVYNGIEQMGVDLSLKAFNTLTIEYGDALIVCETTGDALLAMVAPDSKALGMIRFKSKKLVEELGSYF